MKILILIFAVSLCSFPQVDSIQTEAEEVIEDILADESENEDENLYENVEYLIENKLNLNEAGIQELQSIPFIDLSIAGIIVEHRKKFGLFFSVHELFSVPNLPIEVSKKIIPFLKVENIITIQDEQPKQTALQSFYERSRIEIRSRTISDLQERKAFRDNIYPGSRLKIYNRAKVKFNNQYKAGVLIEKDAGENDLNDFSSFYISAEDLLIFKKIIAGDFLAEFGQGLVLWSPYGFSKSADAVYPLKKRDQKIKEYSSADENQFFRGGAFTAEYKSFSLSAFFSKNDFDANIDTLTNEISSAPIDGFHRTENEMTKKNAGSEQLIGGRLDYKVPNFSGGVLHYNSNFSHKLNYRNLVGRSFSFSSVYYDAVYSSLNIFGEAAYNGSSWAAINNLNISLNRFFTLTASIRNYPAEFFSLHGYGFGEKGGEVTNESGIYFGFRYRSPIGTINFYYDQFKFPSPTFRIPLPSNGDEFLFDFSSKTFKSFESDFRYKYENKDVSTSEISNNIQIQKRLKQNFRFDLTYSPSSKIRLKGRFEFVHLNFSATGHKEEGYLIFQDVKAVPIKPLTLYGRIIFFNTDSFASAVYEYENDLLGLLTNLPMYGNGLRWYVVARYKLFSGFTLNLKYSETYKPRERNLGSGSSEIEGNLDNRLSLQIDAAL